MWNDDEFFVQLLYKLEHKCLLSNLGKSLLRQYLSRLITMVKLIILIITIFLPLWCQALYKKFLLSKDRIVFKDHVNKLGKNYQHVGYIDKFLESANAFTRVNDKNQGLVFSFFLLLVDYFIILVLNKKPPRNPDHFEVFSSDFFLYFPIYCSVPVLFRKKNLQIAVEENQQPLENTK